MWMCACVCVRTYSPNGLFLCADMFEHFTFWLFNPQVSLSSSVSWPCRESSCRHSSLIITADKWQVSCWIHRLHLGSLCPFSTYLCVSFSLAHAHPLVWVTHSLPLTFNHSLPPRGHFLSSCLCAPHLSVLHPMWTCFCELKPFSL